MPPRDRSEQFERVVADTLEVLKQRGLNVTPAAVEDVVEGLAASTAQRQRLTTEEALHALKPAEVADLIVLADEQHPQGSVRRLREDPGTATLATAAAGQLLKAIGQAAKYAVRNHDEQSADLAADLVTELGSGVFGVTDTGVITVPRGVLAEAAQLLDRAADQFASGAWSTCPCGKIHGQFEYDALMPDALRADAEVARQLLVRAIASDS
jgi:hypothetical protein